jgi:hypothetical protein
VGPDFQDPVGVANSPPYFVSTDPIEGSTTASPTAIFSATVGDSNLTDVLHVLWISEFPPGDATIRVDEDTIESNGSPVRRPTTAQPDCTSLARGVPSHLISVGVSDHEFVKPIDPRNPFVTKDNAPPQVVTWTLVRSCQSTP